MLSGKVSTDINVAIVPFILHIFIKKRRFQAETIGLETNVVIFCFHWIFI